LVENTVNQITNEIKDFTDKISFVIEDYVFGLTINDKYDTVEYHHIVAKKDPRALISRVILIKSGIDVNDLINMVWVNKNYYKVLHTNIYYGIVNTSMFMAYLIGGEKGVKSTLFLYQKILGGL
jgi:hypothetical protein